MTAIVVPAASARSAIQPDTVVRVGQGPIAQVSSGGDQIHGGCFMVSAEDPTLPGTNDGVIGTASVTTDNRLNPTGATVTCSIKVNSTLASGTTTSFAGTGAQTGAEPVTYQANSFDTVELCETVTYDDGTTNPDVCTSVISTVIPSQQVWELVQSVLGGLDPIVCPIFASLAGTYGPVEIDPTGDILIANNILVPGFKVYDCPPYDA